MCEVMRCVLVRVVRGDVCGLRCGVRSVRCVMCGMRGVWVCEVWGGVVCGVRDVWEEG